MSSTQHTPGPWAFDGESRVDALQFRKLSDIKVKDDAGVEHDYFEGLIALPYACGSIETRVANAHLISAAPDLFAALSNWIRHLDSKPGSELCAAEEDGLMDAARAAIARATGVAS